MEFSFEESLDSEGKECMDKFIVEDLGIVN